MSHNADTARRTIGVFLVLLVVASPVASGVTLATSGGGAGGSTAALSTPAGYGDVSDTEKYALTNNTSVWERSIFPLRAGSGAAAHTSLGPGIELSVPQATKQLNKHFSVYETGTTVPMTFRPSRAQASESDFDGEDAQLVALRLPTDAEAPTTPSALRDLLGNDSEAEATMVADRPFNITTEQRGDTTVTQDVFDFSPTQPGQYVLVLASPDGNASGYSVANGALEQDGQVTVVGFDAVMVRNHASSVSAPTDATVGSNVTFDVDANTAPASNVSQMVLLYDNETLWASSSTITLSDVSGDVNASVETGISEVNGDFRVVGSPSAFGMNATEQRVSYPVSAQALFDFLAENRDFGENTTVTNSSDAVALNATGTLAEMNASGTVNVSVPGDWPAGDYHWIHVSSAADGADVSSSQGSLTLREGVDLNVSANATSVVRGGDVAFTVTRADTGEGVNATLTIDGATYETDANGTYVHTFESGGTYTVSATRANTDTTVFASDETTVDVAASAIAVSNLSAPSVVLQNETFAVNATLRNTGDAEGTRTVNLTVNGTTVESATRTLGPGENATVSFDYAFTAGERGPVTLGVGEASADVRVDAPATFEYSALSVQPTTVATNETVNASVTVRNTGDRDGDTVVTLTANGTTIDERQIALDAGNETTVDFSTAFESPGTYAVSAGGLPARTVTVLEPASFTYSNLTVAPDTVDAGASASVSVTVSNTGGIGGIDTVTLAEDGQNVTNASVYVDAGASETVTFERVYTEPGTQTLGVGDRTTTLNVTAVDAVPPSVVLTEPSTGDVAYGATLSFRVRDETTNVTDVTVNATTSNGTVERVDLLDAANATNDTTVGVDTDGWHEGDATVNVTAVDAEGNAVTKTYRFDLVSAPVFTGVSPTTESGETPTVTVTYADDGPAPEHAESGINASSATLFVDGTPVAFDGVGPTEASVTLDALASGTHSLKAVVADDANHTSARTWTLDVDADAPTVNVTPRNDVVSDGSPFEAAVVANDPALANATVAYANETAVVHTETVTDRARLTDGAIETTWDGRSGGAFVPDGTYTVTVNASDAYGHTATANATLRVDTTGPTVTDAAVTPNATNATGTVTANATFADPADVTSATYVLRKVGTGVRVSNTTTDDVTSATFDASNFVVDGDYRLTVVAVDDAANRNTTATNATVAVDSTPPALAASIARHGTNGTVTVATPSGEDVANLTGTVEHDGTTTELTNFTPAGDGSYNATFNASSDGVYNVTVRGEDDAENVGNASASAEIRTVSGQSNVTVYLEDSGIVAELNLTTTVDQGFYSMSGSDRPSQSLPSNASSVSTLVGQVSQSIDGNITTGSTIAFPAPGAANANGGSPFTVQYYDAENESWERYDTKRVENYTVSDDAGNEIVNGTYGVANVSHFSTYTATSIDDTPPTVEFESLNAPANATAAWVNANITDDSGVNASTVTLAWNGSDVTGEASVTETPNGNATVAYEATGLEPGASYDVTVSANDTNANANTTNATFTVDPDTADPTATIDSPSDNATFPAGTESVALNATFGDADSGVADVNATLDGTTLSGVNLTAGTFNATVSPDTGEHAFALAVTDRAGNVTETSVDFTISADTAGPVVNVSSPVDGKTYANATTSVPLIANATDLASGVDSVTVLVDGTDVTGDANTTDYTNVTYDVPVTPGSTHTVNVSATDGAGNANWTNATFSVAPDEDAPDVTVAPDDDTTFPSDTVSVNATVTYFDALSAIDPADVTLQVDGTTVSANENATLTLKNETRANVTVSNLSTGSQHSIIATVTDAAGNTEQVSATFSVAEGSQLQVTRAGVAAASLNADGGVTAGENVTVTADVANVGDEPGERDIALRQNGTDVASQTVTLNAGATTTLAFERTLGTPGTYAFAVGETSAGTVSVDANYSVTGSVNATSLTEGDDVTVTVTGTNELASAQTVTVTVAVPNASLSTPVSLDLPASGQNSTTVAFSDLPAGTHDVLVGGQVVDTLDVAAASDGSTPTVPDESDDTTDESDDSADDDDDSTPAPPVNEPTVTRTVNAGAVTVDVTNVPDNGTVDVPANTTGTNPNATLSGFKIGLNGTAETTFTLSNDTGSTPALDAGDPISYFNISHEVAEENIATVTFTFTVTASELDARGLSTSQVALYRHHEGAWNALETSFVSRDGDTLTFEATSPGLSVYAVGGSPAEFAVTDATVDTTEPSTGESVTVRATVENTGGSAGEYTVPLVVDGATVDERTVSLDANEETTVTFEHAFESTGSHSVAVDDADAGSVSVSEGSNAQQGSTTTPVSSQGDFPVVPVLVMLVVIALIVVGLYVYREDQR
ncbi:PGF-pre-PGF domain-containing protein (plasmid) [Halarchaeum sp. CBA1220]|uniref:CARDB domain-containing protein n=1 Tax=Halarchaeum sp. CBA1220 TaxID=1853682 RepID=UPI000F3A8D63|nr:CARDB domain-containing protein [Halarchaeum sp. CBA1220]QLC34982.1 PGF-pre-PGF domain-containing protein [Halarchaeum sp. CBA1220]